MAKGLPYFKFIPTEWITGDISYEDFDVQGLFINICAIYWQRDGKLSLEDIERRFKKPTALTSLLDRFISVNEGLISIAFLDEQFSERNHVSQSNSKNGSKGGRPKGSKTLEKKPTALFEKAKKSNIELEEELEREKETELEKEINIRPTAHFLNIEFLEILNYENNKKNISAATKIPFDQIDEYIQDFKLKRQAEAEVNDGNLQYQSQPELIKHCIAAINLEKEKSSAKKEKDNGKSNYTISHKQSFSDKRNSILEMGKAAFAVLSGAEDNNHQTSD